MFRFTVFTLVSLNVIWVLGDRIQGGSDTNITEVPYQVSVAITDGDIPKFPWCGGTIISEKEVLTTSICVNMGIEFNNTYYVRYGSSFRSKGWTEVKVSNIIQHEDFDIKTYENNIALMVLEEPIKFDDFAQPIALAEFGDKIEEGTMTTISGWGTYMNEPDKGHEVLQKGSIPITDIKKCVDAFTTIKVGPGNICAQNDDEGPSLCPEDRGSPMVAKNILYGIASLGGCDNGDNPSVFVDIAYYRKWIDSKRIEYNAL